MTFSVLIKKEIKKNNKQKFMKNSLSDLVDNLSEEISKIQFKHKFDNENCE